MAFLLSRISEAWKQELHYGELLETIRTIDELCK